MPVEGRDQLTWRLALMHDLDAHHHLKLLAGTAAQDRDQYRISAPEQI